MTARKAAPAALLSLALLLTVAGCGSTGAGGGAAPGGAASPAPTSAASTTPGGSTSGGTGSSGSTGGTGATGGQAASDDIATLEDLEAAVARDHGTADWFPAMTDLTLETWLGARVIVVHTTLTVTDPDYETVNRKRNELADAFRAYTTSIAPNIAHLDGDVMLAAIASQGRDAVPMQDAFDLPARPETAEDVRAWLDAVYGPGGLVPLGPDETWPTTITDVRFEDPGWGTGKVLWVETSLATNHAIEAQLVQQALFTTGSPLMADWYLEVTDGSGPAGGAPSLADQEPGASGWFYTP